MRPPGLSRPHALLSLALALAAIAVFAATALAALGDRTLRQGMSGDDVMELQRLVTYLGYPTPRYGRFTSRTKTDMIHYERSTGLSVNGVISQWEGGAIVRRAREKREREATSGYDFGERVLQQGMRGDDVMTLQRLVTQLGYPTPRYGTFTSRTKSDIIHYERSTGLRVNGVVDLGEQATIKRRAEEKASSGSYVFPIRGWHSYGGSGSRFGAPRSGHRHQGQDIAASSGTPLVAVTSGTVYYRQYQAGGAGYYVVIRGNDRRDYVYMHMRGPAWVAPGERVRPGTRVGSVGSTGTSKGPHLHFEMWTAHWYAGGHPFDPLPYLKRWDAYS
jgi:peptidoglycan hydrolase-like protein with peptidoglycan-binding domain